MCDLNGNSLTTTQSIHRLIEKSKNSRRAFTIIELLVVIGIIGILMGVLLGVFSGSSESARAAKCQANMRNLAMAVQSYGMSNNYYPRASEWAGSETDPYVTAAETRRTCLEEGQIWGAVNHDRSVFACPGHQKYAKEHGKKVEPLWSYAMNSYFNYGSGDNKARGYGNLRRPDRLLLFAEVPYAEMKVGEVTIQSGNPSTSEVNPVLDRESESIGFNHKDGKNVMGHVCFADGHVEKLRAPKDEGNVQQLTGWLCQPWTVIRNKDGSTKIDDFDVRFDGKTSTYEKIDKPEE